MSEHDSSSKSVLRLCQSTSAKNKSSTNNLVVLPSKYSSPVRTRSEDILKANLQNISPTLLDLYDRLLEGKVSRAKLTKKLPPDSLASESERWLNLEHLTDITILNDSGDAKVRVKFTSANLSLTKQVSRSHYFWWEHPQMDLRFYCIDSSGRELTAHPVRTTPHFVELKILFPEPIKLFDSLSYEISYTVTKAFLNHQFYSKTSDRYEVIKPNRY